MADDLLRTHSEHIERLNQLAGFPDTPPGGGGSGSTPGGGGGASQEQIDAAVAGHNSSELSHSDIRSAVADMQGQIPDPAQFATKAQGQKADSALQPAHNTNTTAHGDIRQAIAAVENAMEDIDTAGPVAAHNTSSSAHNDIRNAIAAKLSAEQLQTLLNSIYATQDDLAAQVAALELALQNVDVSGPISTHNTSSQSHSDIRTTISSLASEALYMEDVADALSTHNDDSTAHTDIRQALIDHNTAWRAVHNNRLVEFDLMLWRHQDAITEDEDRLDDLEATVEMLVDLAGHTHQFATEWSMDEVAHWHACIHPVCQERADYAPHISGEWIEDVAPQPGIPGTQHKECTVCGYVLETGEIPALLEPPGNGAGYGPHVGKPQVASKTITLSASKTLAQAIEEYNNFTEDPLETIFVMGNANTYLYMKMPSNLTLDIGKDRTVIFKGVAKATWISSQSRYTYGHSADLATSWHKLIVRGGNLICEYFALNSRAWPDQANAYPAMPEDIEDCALEVHNCTVTFKDLKSQFAAIPSNYTQYTPEKKAVSAHAHFHECLVNFTGVANSGVVNTVFEHSYGYRAYNSIINVDALGLVAQYLANAPTTAMFDLHDSSELHAPAASIGGRICLADATSVLDIV